MPHIRTARAQQVAVPPASSASLELSRDDRQHLRAVRRRAFERHQENAQWAFELLHGAAEPPSELSEVVQRPTAAASVESIERVAAQDQEEHEAAQRIFQETLATLKAADDAAALAECEARVRVQREELLAPSSRKLAVVAL